MDGNAALALVKEIGIVRLGGYDGCVCTSCAVQGIHIENSCRKSGANYAFWGKDFYGNTIRVWTHHMDADGAELEAIAREVARQIYEDDEHPVRVRYCDYTDDKQCRCTYCHKPREDVHGYLCKACLSKSAEPAGFGTATMADRDYRKHEFSLPE